MRLKPCLCFLELPQLQAIFDAIEAVFYVSDGHAQIVDVALEDMQLASQRQVVSAESPMAISTLSKR